MRRSAATEIAAELRREIVSLDLAPGTTLSRKALQDRFGTSSTPISDALLDLQDQRLVTIYPQHATLISLIDLSDAEEASFLRRSIEVEVVGLLASARDPAAIAGLRERIRLQAAVAAIDRLDEFVRLDGEFHFALYDMANVGNLWHLVCKRSGNLDRIRQLNLSIAGRMAEILCDHQQIVDAISEGRISQAQSLMRQHLSQTVVSALDLVKSHPDYFSTAANGVRRHANPES